MGLTSQILSIPYYLFSFFRQSMSQPPTEVPGLFIRFPEYGLDTHAWLHMVRDCPTSCKLVRMTYCKTNNGKRHEFLVLHFSHPTHPSAQATVIVDRAVKEPSQLSAIASPGSFPSQSTPARDSVRVVGQGSGLNSYLSKTYGSYNHLCVLDYPLGSSEPPSATEFAVLLVSITDHQPDYNLYDYNCYWYANMVFEACKELFPGHRETCYRHDDRGRYYLNIPIHDTQCRSGICGAYRTEWQKFSRNSVNQHTMHQHELEEARRGREAAERRVKELEAQLQTFQNP